MAKTKKETTAAVNAVEETVTGVSETKENSPEVKVENTEVQEKAPVKETKSSPKFYDDDKVKIKSVKRAGKKISANTNRIIEFNSDGIAEVSGLEAKYLLSIPGFEIA